MSLVLTILTVSCNISTIEDFVVGENFIKDKTGITMIDTLTIQSSIVKFDSIISNSSGRLLVGNNYNSFSGYKNSKAYMEMVFDDDISYTEFVFDSICMVLNYDTYYSGDTTVTQTFEICQLQEEMELDDNSYLYTTSRFTYNSSPLGSITLTPRPNTNSTINIRLADRFGEKLATMIKEENDTIEDETLFKEFFKGLVIQSKENVKGSVIGFSTADSETSESTETETTSTKPEIRLYYHLTPNPGDLSDLYYKFSFNSDGIYFNQITEDNSNSLMEGISETENERSTKLTNNQLFVQSGVQVFSKIKIPYLDNLFWMGENSAYIGATLRLFPVKGTYKTADLPDSLYVYNADRKNHITGQVTAPGSTEEYVYATLNVNVDVEETVYYEVDISSYIDTDLKESMETNRSFIIGYGSTAAKKTANHIILGGANSGKYSPELNVYYYHN